MFALRLITAAGCLPLIFGAPIPSILSSVATHASNLLTERSANKYTIFGGTGAISDGWPAQSAWISSFDDMFESNQEVMKSSCAQFGVAENTDSEIALMKSSIQTVATSSGIDSRFILAIVMQESNGCIRAPTTNYGVRNPGLMQSHNGAGTCNDGSVQNPCPEAEILQMIKDGTTGTSSGDGLVQCIKQSGATDDSKFFKAARIYNSGSIDSTKNLGAGIATHCYASDIASRLTGWFSGPSGCNPVNIASFAGVKTSVTPDVAAPVVVAAPPPPTSAGGVFAERPAASTTTTTPLPTTTTAILSAVKVPEPTVAPAPTVAPVSSAPTPAAVIIASIPSPSPVAEPAHKEAVKPTPAPAPVVVASPTPAPVSDAGAISAGTACTTEGLWNCINSSSFQQCASGSWSAVQSLAAGTECTSGQTMAFSVSAIAQRV